MAHGVACQQASNNPAAWLNELPPHSPGYFPPALVSLVFTRWDGFIDSSFTQFCSLDPWRDPWMGINGGRGFNECGARWRNYWGENVCVD